MATDSTICCCTSNCWTKLFAWLQIIGGSLGVVGFGVLIANFDKLQYPEDQKENRPVFLASFWVALAECLMSLILGLILLVGTVKEQICLMWTWIVIECVQMVAILVSRVVDATYVGLVSLLPAVISLPIFAFIIWCVRSRIRDVKAGQGVKPSESEE